MPALEKFSEEPPLRKKRGEREYEDRLRKLKWPTLETRRLFLSLAECYKIVFGIMIFFNLPSAIQPALTIRINYMLSQESVIHINILFQSESCRAGIVYQDRREKAKDPRDGFCREIRGKHDVIQKL